jgi:hypothetical protein
MAYLAQDQSLQNRLRSFRLTTADSRESKRHDAKRNSSYYKKEKLLVMGKTEASFILGSVIGQMVPVNGEPWLTRGSTGIDGLTDVG